MSIELHRDQPVFDKCLTVRQCQGTSESRTTPLSFRVIPGGRAVAGSSGQSERLFHFEVTDENDPYFLYVLDVGEQDFHLLKRDQALLVEFPVFPMKMVELLNLCLESEAKAAREENAEEEDDEMDDYTSVSGAHGSHSRFVAKLDTASGTFSVIEMNEFKQLTHISLQMKQGNDAAIKSYLASRLQLYMNRCASMGKELFSASSALEVESKGKAELNRALEEIKSHKDVSEEHLRSSHTQEIATLQMNLMNQADAARERYEGQLDGCRAEIDSLRNELKQVRHDGEEASTALKQEKQHLAFRERELSRLLESAESDRDRVFGECREISAAKRKSDDEVSRLERELARTGAKCEALGLQVADREDMVATARGLQSAAEDGRRLMEEKLDMYLTDAENLREKIKQGGMEITRGNAVIQRLQVDKKTLNEKVKIKSDVIRKQENLVQNLKTQNAELERSVLAEQDATKMARAQGESLSTHLDEAKARLAESTKIIASNKEVIAYLNEEINKWQLGLRTGTEGMAAGTGLGVTGAVEPSKWRSFDANETDKSAQMFSPDTTKDLSYGGYAGATTTTDLTTDQLGLGGMADTVAPEGGSGLENLDYYADAESKMDFARVSAAGGQTLKYAWQAEDFGLDTDSK